MAMIPQQNVGAFVVVTRSPLTRFTNMSDGINDLVSELSGNKPQVIPHPELILKRQTVDAHQFAFIHFNISTLRRAARTSATTEREIRVFW
jgi:hypothetical protein